jgi:heavy metal translocating P-type ATPase
MNTCCSNSLSEKKTTGDFSTGLRQVIRLKIVNAVMATVLLLTGLIYKEAFPDQKQVGELLLFLAAFSVFLPIMISGIKGFFVKDNRFMTEQLVMFASIALMVNGELAAATVIPIIMVIGHVLEEKSIIGVEEAINSLKELGNRKAHRLEDSSELDVEISSLKIGERIVIYPGETVPIDGVVNQGQSLVNQAHVTGESAPIEVENGSQLFAGTMNLTGKLTMKVTQTSDNTLLSNIVALLEEAGNTKIPVVKIIEKYLDLYFPAVIMVAAITLFLTHEISRVVTVLVISCPCSFVLASPSAMIAALVLASRKGIMIRNSTFVEGLADVDTLIFDKTGTVTSGFYQVVDIFPQGLIEKKEVVATAAICASGSIHPVSQAIIRHCEEQNIGFIKAESQAELHGKGVKAENGTTTYRLGKAEWVFGEIGQEPPVESSEDSLSSVWIAVGNKILGKISLADLPRPEFTEIIAECRQIGIKELILLTGDKQLVAQKIGELFKFDQIKAECLPQDKLEYVQECKKQEKKVMFIGDGINDALALKASDIGVAIGNSGADIAIQSSDITLKSESLEHIPFMFRLSRRIHRTINQNIIIGTGFSLVMIGLATFGVITPVWGAIAHNLGTFFVLVNSARLLNKQQSWQHSHQPQLQS